MVYNIKPLHLHCVFHGIRFKVNKGWVSGIDTLLFYIPFALITTFIQPICIQAHTAPSPQKQ